MIPSSTPANNLSMPFNVTDILQSSEFDTSTSCKLPIDMAQLLAASGSSSSSSPSVYSTCLPSSHTISTNLSNPIYESSSISNNYYGSLPTNFSPSNYQYYDYGNSFHHGGNSAVQYSPSSYWYRSTASMKIFCF